MYMYLKKYLLNLYKSFVKTSRTEHVQVCYHTGFNRFTLRVPALLSAIALFSGAYLCDMKRYE